MSLCPQVLKATVTNTLSRCHNVRVLFDNNGLNLLTLNDQSPMKERYAGNLKREKVERSAVEDMLLAA